MSQVIVLNIEAVKKMIRTISKVKSKNKSNSKTAGFIPLKDIGIKPPRKSGFTPHTGFGMILKRRTGFTMVEILVSLMILTVGLLSLLSLFPIGLRSAGKASNISQAAILGMYHIDYITQIYKYNFSDLYANMNGGSGTFVSNSNFTWRTAVQILDAERLYQVTVSVYWNDRGRQQEEQFISYVSKYQ